jgi:hypothetical protein
MLVKNTDSALGCFSAMRVSALAHTAERVCLLCCCCCCRRHVGSATQTRRRARESPSWTWCVRESSPSWREPHGSGVGPLKLSPLQLIGSPTHPPTHKPAGPQDWLQRRGQRPAGVQPLRGTQVSEEGGTHKHTRAATCVPSCTQQPSTCDTPYAPSTTNTRAACLCTQGVAAGRVFVGG